MRWRATTTPSSSIKTHETNYKTWTLYIPYTLNTLPKYFEDLPSSKIKKETRFPSKFEQKKKTAAAAATTTKQHRKRNMQAKVREAEKKTCMEKIKRYIYSQHSRTYFLWWCGMSICAQKGHLLILFFLWCLLLFRILVLLLPFETIFMLRRQMNHTQHTHPHMHIHSVSKAFSTGMFSCASSRTYTHPNTHRELY